MIKAKTISYDRRIHIFWMLVSLMGLSAVLYVYAVLSTTHNTALRQNLEVKLTNLATETSALEFALIEKKNEVSIEVAYAAGFHDVVEPHYVSRVRTNSLSLNTQSR